METTNEQKIMQRCQQAKAFVSQHTKEYIDFVKQTLDNEDFVSSATALLPFDNSINAKLRFMDDKLLIKSLGVSLMKMELEPAKYSLGISLELVNEEGISQPENISYITAGHTLDNLREYVNSDDFTKEVRTTFEEVIEGSFAPKS